MRISFSIDYTSNPPVLGVFDLRSVCVSRTADDPDGLRLAREVEAKCAQGHPSAIFVKASFSRNGKQWACYHAPDIRGRGLSILRGDYSPNRSDFPKRQGGRDAEGNLLETCHDEIDEILHYHARLPSSMDTGTGDDSSQTRESQVGEILRIVNQVEDMAHGGGSTFPNTPSAYSAAVGLMMTLHNVSN